MRRSWSSVIRRARARVLAKRGTGATRDGQGGGGGVRSGEQSTRRRRQARRRRGVLTDPSQITGDGGGRD